LRVPYEVIADVIACSHRYETVPDELGVREDAAINGAAGVLAASVGVVTSIAFSIDMTIRIGGGSRFRGRC
jgi:hypothetical protein